jgi:hypothetical protein
MGDLCAMCRRPLLVTGEQFDDAKHCPDDPREHVSVRDPKACALLGVHRRDMVIRAQELRVAARDATIRTQDELLGRARAVLVDVGRQLSDALEQLPREARRG